MQNPGGPIGISDIVDIVAIEHAGFAALPPEHHLEDGLWVLRMAGGLAKRANSANPRAPGAELDAARLARIEAVYRSAGLPVILRINPLAAPEADALLVAHGYQFVDDCRVMTARLAPAAGTAPAPMPDGIVTTADTTIPDFWHDTFAQLDGLDAHGRATRRAMLDALDRPHAAITLRDVSGEVLGIGLAVRDGAHVGLFDVRVAPAARGRGLGRADRLPAGRRRQRAGGQPVSLARLCRRLRVPLPHRASLRRHRSQSLARQPQSFLLGARSANAPITKLFALRAKRKASTAKLFARCAQLRGSNRNAICFAVEAPRSDRKAFCSARKAPRHPFRSFLLCASSAMLPSPSALLRVGSPTRQSQRFCLAHDA
jgi:hypothetical protein